MLVSTLVDLLAVANILVAVPLILMVVSMNSTLYSDAAYARQIVFRSYPGALHTNVAVCPHPINESIYDFWILGMSLYYGFGCFVLDSIWFAGLGAYFRSDTTVRCENINAYESVIHCVLYF